MNTAPEKYIESLNELLLKKKALLSEILTLTQAQTEVITEDGLDSLNELIDKKQLRIDSIEKLNEEFEIYYSRLKDTLGISNMQQLDAAGLGGTTLAGAKRLKALTAEIMDVITQISEIEKVNSKKSNELLEHLGKEIRKINQSKKMNNAYNPQPYSTPSYFMDKKK